MRKKGKETQFRRDLRVVVFFFLSVIVLVLAFCLVWKIGGIASDRQVKTALLRDAGLPEDLVSAVRDYDSWNDFLMYTDGYEIAWVDVDPDTWVTPEGWTDAQTSVREIESQHDRYISSAVRDRIASDFTVAGWYYAEDMQAENYADRWYLYAFYDGNGTILLYRAHHLWGI